MNVMLNWQFCSRHSAMANQVETTILEEMLDRETGEPVQYISSNQPIYVCRTNEETGEVEEAPISSVNHERRKTFQVPKNALMKYQQMTMNSNLIALADLFNDNNLQSQYCSPPSIEHKFLHDTHNISPIVFLLPTFFVFPFPAWLTVISIIIELCLHMWAHKINKDCKDPHMMYKSPLHILTSQFCAFCKSTRYMKKIGALQDARALKIYSRKPTYVERISVMT